ncbi:aminopeptidase [Clostridium autoethanogenum]|uniref:aminopeptidase n=1 Tax=Clostridium autoethanogenum TaxID=84023 RepID=UPI001604C619|nr:aminopeptidase [Clostridium autoethanogenum]
MDLEKGSKIVLDKCLGLKKDENVLIVTDETKLNIGQALYKEAQKMGGEAVLALMKSGEVSGQEPPKCISQAMKAADVVICATKASITHTNAKIDAVKNGARIATMPGITENMFSEGPIKADYSEVEKLTIKITDLLTKAKTAKIIKDDHVLTMSLNNRNGVPSTGVYRKRSTSGNLPSGEAYIAPVEETAEGEMIIDGSMVGVGKVSEPLYLKIKDGKLKEIKGKDADKLNILLYNERNSSLCELGIGTNPEAKVTGVILEDEKIYGTVHIAFGTNTSFGGTVKADCHIDGVILNPDLYLDNVHVIDRGKFLV